MALFMVIVAIFAAENYNTLLVVFMMLFLFTYQITLGTYAWVYLGQVSCDESLSIGVGALWFAVFIFSVVTNSMFDKMGSPGTFGFFAAGSFASAVFFYFFLKETKGKSREEQKNLYSGVKGSVLEDAPSPKGRDFSDNSSGKVYASIARTTTSDNTV